MVLKHAYGLDVLPKIDKSQVKFDDIKIPKITQQEIRLIIGTNNYPLIHPQESKFLDDKILNR